MPKRGGERWPGAARGGADCLSGPVPLVDFLYHLWCYSTYTVHLLCCYSGCQVQKSFKFKLNSSLDFPVESYLLFINEL
jgi:hypothetical protein